MAIVIGIILMASYGFAVALYRLVGMPNPEITALATLIVATFLAIYTKLDDLENEIKKL